MKYLILAIMIALIGCSAEPSSISGPSQYVEPADSSQENNDMKSPFQWCAEEDGVMSNNSYDTNINPIVDCTTPVDIDTYNKYYKYECYTFGACNPNGMI